MATHVEEEVGVELISQERCEGDGSCYQRCKCVCFSQRRQDTCTCEHTDHSYRYCPVECPYHCRLFECHNFPMCNQKRPFIELWVHNGMCAKCAVLYGRILFTEIREECMLCFEQKQMIVISCEKHMFCLTCWKTYCETERESYPTTCPVCRESIWNWRRTLR
jgi:hypothetical protein